MGPEKWLTDVKFVEQCSECFGGFMYRYVCVHVGDVSSDEDCLVAVSEASNLV